MKHFLLISALCISSVLAAQWQNQNLSLPYEGFIADIEITDPLTAWAYPHTSTGLRVTKDYFKTVNGGETWIRGAISGISSDWYISNLYPIDADTCYAAMLSITGGGGIMKTVNGGTTWTQSGSDMFQNPASFTNLVYFYDAQHGVAIGDPIGTDVLRYEIYVTDTYGKDWSRVPETHIPPVTFAGETGVVNLFNVSQGVIYFATTYGDVYRSIDQGNTWTKSGTGIPAYMEADGTRHDISDIAFTDSLHGIVLQANATGGGIVCQTNDGGSTWNVINSSGNLFITDIDAVPGTGILVSSGLSVSGFSGTSFSMDNGLSWVTWDNGVSHTAIDFLNAGIGYTGQYTYPGLPGGMWKFSGNFDVIPCRSDSVSPGIITLSNIAVCPNDVFVISARGAVAPTEGLTHGFALIISEFDLSYNNNPLAAGVNGGTGIMPPEGEWSFYMPFPGTFYITPVVFANAFGTGNIAGLTLDSACTFTGQSSVITVLPSTNSFCSVGINEPGSKSPAGHFIYPQPAAETATIVFESDAPLNTSVLITDMCGRLVYNELFQCSAGLNHHVVRTAELPGGVYFITIFNRAFQLSSRLIKM